MYFITCFTKYNNKTVTGFTDIGHARTFGYYKDKDVALEMVKCNNCDIYEQMYRYAVVEEIPEGLYTLAENRWFFEWDSDTKSYIPIEPFIDNGGNYAFG